MKVSNCWLAPCGGTSNLSHVGSKYYGKEKDKVVVDKKKRSPRVNFICEYDICQFRYLSSMGIASLLRCFIYFS